MQGLRAFQRYFDFAGRSDRAEYWQFLGICVVACFIALALDFFLVGDPNTTLLTNVAFLALACPFCAATTRRLHDREYSGWLVGILVALGVVRTLMLYEAGRNPYSTTGDLLATLINLTKYAGIGLEATVFVQLIRAGMDGANKFGPPPNIVDGPPPTVEQLFGRLKQFGSSPAPTPPTITSTADPLQQIARLAELRDAGALTEAEFTERKAALLDRL